MHLGSSVVMSYFIDCSMSGDSVYIIALSLRIIFSFVQSVHLVCK